jgi:hypothetical protein
MARFAIARLASSDLVYVPEPPVFVDLTAGILAQADGDFAGTDSVLSTITGFVGNEADAGPSFDNDLAGMGFNPGDFQASTFDPINTDYAAFVPGTEGQLSANETTLGINPAPGGGAPNPNNPPTTPGGSGPGVADPCAEDYSHPQTCNFTTAQLATLASVWQLGQLSSRCASHVYKDTSARRGFPQNPGEIYGAILASIRMVSGDTAICAPSLYQAAPNSPNWNSYIFLTITPTKTGHFEFVFEVTEVHTALRPHFGACIDIVA